MTKVLFAGPSLHGVALAHPGLVRRPPASQGDVQAAVLDGASVVGLVDGLFETVAAVWHKEILFALSEGVTVLGAASLGALRAAECHAFGMVAVGGIAGRYLSGALDDDAAVAQLHAPAELGFMPLTEALVDCEARIEALAREGAVEAGEARALLEAARATFFKDRTWRRVLASAGLSGPRAADLLVLLKDRRAGPKRADALLLVEAMAGLPDERRAARPSWPLSRTAAWLRSLARTGDGPPSCHDRVTLDPV